MNVRKGMPAILAAAVALATATGCSDSDDDADEAPATDTGSRIAYAWLASSGAKERIYTVRPDGSGRRAVSQPEKNGSDDSQADWSPDGRKIVFRRFYGERVDLLVVNQDGSGQENLTRRSCTGKCLGSEEPAWSPDGTKIAFVRALGPFSDEGFPAVVGLFVMDADGSNVRQLTQLEPNSGTEDHFPTWSPDGRRIAFMRWNGASRPRNASAIHSVNADGGNSRLLRRIPRRWPGGGSSDWSPDGSKILFTTYCYYQDCGGPSTGAQLFTMNPDGGDLRKLTDVKGNAYQGGWSPDGAEVVFTSNRVAGGPSDIYTAKADGTELRRLTRAPSPELFSDYPDWQPLH